MKRFLVLCLLFFMVSNLFAQSENKIIRLKLINNLTIERKNQSIEISGKILSEFKDKHIVIKDQSSTEEIIYQWLQNGNLLIQADFGAKERKVINISIGKSEGFKSLVYGRFVPERYDDFAWENDKIAFRMYGKALEKIKNQNAYGMDVWTKRTNNFIIDKWYKLNNYHEDNGDGLDFFHVGLSMGAGDIIPFLNNQFTYLGNYASYKILENGPIRFSFQLVYPETNISGKAISAVKTVSLDAGSQLNRIEASYGFKGLDNLPVFAGLVHWDGEGTKYIDNNDQFASYWPKDSKNGIVGTAILFPYNKVKINDVLKHLAVSTELENNKSFVFYSGGVWSKAGSISNNDEWKSYLIDFSKKIKSPIKVEKL